MVSKLPVKNVSNNIILVISNQYANININNNNVIYTLCNNNNVIYNIKYNIINLNNQIRKDVKR